MPDEEINEQINGTGGEPAEPSWGDLVGGLADEGLREIGGKYEDLPAALKAIQEAPSEPQEVHWRDSIEDEDLKKTADRFDSPAALVKALTDTRKEISTRLKVPGEDASDEDVSKFRKALGVPESVDGYEFKPPEDYEWTDQDQALYDMAAPIAHEFSVPQKAFEGFVGKWLDMVSQAKLELKKSLDQGLEDGTAALKKEWGSDYEGNLNLGARAAKAIGGEEFQAFLAETKIEGAGLICDHPAVNKFLATVGRRADEGDVFLGPAPDEQSSIQSRIDAILKEHPVATESYKSAVVQNELQPLYKKLYGDEPIA